MKYKNKERKLVLSYQQTMNGTSNNESRINIYRE